MVRNLVDARAWSNCSLARKQKTQSAPTPRSHHLRAQRTPDTAGELAARRAGYTNTIRDGQLEVLARGKPVPPWRTQGDMHYNASATRGNLNLVAIARSWVLAVRARAAGVLEVGAWAAGCPLVGVGAGRAREPAGRKADLKVRRAWRAAAGYRSSSIPSMLIRRPVCEDVKVEMGSFKTPPKNTTTI